MVSRSFERYSNFTTELTFDYHTLARSIASWGLVVFDNIRYLWLESWTCFGCMSPSRHIYEALDVEDDMGYSQVGPHLHCEFPVDDQGKELQAFYNKFLLDLNVDTNVWKTTGNHTWDETAWVDWIVPKY